MIVRTRFAPSPTGELHLGGLRTALYAWLWARRHGNEGSFAIRIEDTDRERLVPGSAERMLALLQRLGITWDDEPSVQSEHLDHYRVAAAQLMEQGNAYRCDCTPERLRELRDAQSATKQPTRYDGRCRERSDVDPSKPHVIRFRIPGEGSIIVTDLIHGDISVNFSTLDDFVLLKSDGWPTYHLAHVVDDHAMRTTHVIRGDEWLPSLPKHMLLFRAFRWESPQYAHLPLLLNAQHKKLSKRDGSADVEAFLAWCLPDALRNFVALLGWNPSGDREIYTQEELIAAFDIARVNRSPAIVDVAKLEWMNGEYIRARTPSELAASIRSVLPAAPSADPAFLLRVIALEQPRLKRIDAFPQWYFLPYRREAPLEWKRTGAPTTRANLEALLEKLRTIDDWGTDTTPAQLEAVIKPWITERGLGVGETLWPMRVALSGQKASPSPFELAWAFGREETLRRLAAAIATPSSPFAYLAK